MQEMRIQSLGWKDLLEEEMATHSSILAWKISWTEEPDRLQSMGSQKSRIRLNNSITMRFNKCFVSLKVKVTQSCPTLLRSHGLQPTRLLCPRKFPGKNTGVGFYFLVQGIFQTQGSNQRLLHWQASSLPLRHQGSPTVLQSLLLKKR